MGYRWGDLEARPAPDRLEFYKILLIHLGTHGSRLEQEIFANASAFIRKPVTLSALMAEIDKLDWYSARQEGLGDLYEGLLQKNANEKKSGAGQYFTPRPLIDRMVAVMQPTLADIIQDPAACTRGFLIAANHYLRKHSDPDGWTEARQRKYRRTTFYGMEHVQDTHRLALRHRPPDPRRPDGQVQPAHHPAPAHRHLLRPGRQDQHPVDACRERLDPVPDILKRRRQAVLAAATSGMLTEDWRTERQRLDDWPVQPLADVGEIGRGKSKHRPRNDPRLYGGPYPFVQTGAMAQSRGRITEHTQTYSEMGLAQGKLWPAGTVCITIAANIADAAILGYPACFPASVVGFIADPPFPL